MKEPQPTESAAVLSKLFDTDEREWPIRAGQATGGSVYC